LDEVKFVIKEIHFKMNHPIFFLKLTNQNMICYIHILRISNKEIVSLYMTNPKPVIIYLIRHAQSDITVHDDRTRPLTEKGKRDSAKLPELFKHLGIDLMFSSPYKRTLDTLAPIALNKNKKIVEIEEFCERRTGGWIDDFDGFACKQWADRRFKLPGGESLQEVQKRNIGVLEKILGYNAGKTIIIGTHGTAMATIINHYDSSYNCDFFMRIKNLMPFIMRMIFTGKSLSTMEEIILPF
jgi:2,3-bisphosphoglycerate-dependent phosphoglycerate mutase